MALIGEPDRERFHRQGGSSAKLVPLFAIAAREKSALVLYLDSAGARVSEGLEALGAFRRLFREGLAARVAGAPLAVVLGRNCFGGASMLAHLGARRLFSPGTQLAMSGPSILAQSAGADALDEMFRAIAQAAIGAASRARTSGANSVWSPELDLAAWLREALAPAAGPGRRLHERHGSPRRGCEKGLTPRQPEALRRKELERLYPEGYRVIECDGVVTGEASVKGATVPLLGLVGSSPVGAERAWRFAQSAWRLSIQAPERLEVLLDCESHAPRLDDEKVVLSEYLVDMGAALAALASRGTKIELTILDRGRRRLRGARCARIARGGLQGGRHPGAPGCGGREHTGAGATAWATSPITARGLADEERTPEDWALVP
ncbi:MAG: hypothetical protein IPH30_15210 [Betaproteobacteria bacterium]|nr:hypothetical protein [Betaproteobacteria bacterium]